MFCESCGARLEGQAKFCGGCGTAVPKKDAVAATHLTTDELIDLLREEGEELSDSLFKVLVTFSDNRSQNVFALISIDEDGDSEYDKVTLYSYFAPEKFNAKKAIAAVDGRWFGVTNDGGNGGFQLVTSFRVETLTSAESFGGYVSWIGRQADALEEELTGVDVY